MSEDEIPEEEPTPALTPFLVRFGGTVGAAALAALLGSSPAALRMSAALSGTGELDVIRGWFALAGLAIAPMIVLVPLARLAREGLRGFLSTGGGRALERASAAMFFVCTWLWSLSLLGAVLREKTHHRALGGVTFALLALGAGVFLALVSHRLAAILGALRTRRRTLGTLASVAAMALALAILGLRVARAAPHLSSYGRATLVDGFALALALAFFARKTFENRRWLARLGPPVAFVLLVLSMHALATSPIVAQTMQRVCPVHFALLEGLAKLAL